MEKNKKKYDTNPLDPDVARQTDNVWGAQRRGPSNTEEMSGATREIGRTPNEQARRDEAAEAPTRRMDNPAIPASYPSVFIPPTHTPPATYGVGGQPLLQAAPPTSRTVPGLGLPENVALILPYLPFPFIGGAAGAIELYLMPRNEVRTRFHAAQGLALHLFVLVIGFLFNIADKIADNTLGGIFSLMVGIASGLFTLAAFIFFIVSMIRVWKGEEHRIHPLAELTRWFNEKIEPKQ